MKKSPSEIVSKIVGEPAPRLPEGYSAPTPQTGNKELIVLDWRDGGDDQDWAYINKALKRFGAQILHVQIEGTDQVGVVVCDPSVTQEEAQKFANDEANDYMNPETQADSAPQQ